MPNPIDSLSYLVPQVNAPTNTVDGQTKALRGLRDGTLSVADFLLICALEGNVFQANAGIGATVIAGHVGYSQLQPEANLDVPQGTSVIVLPPSLYLQTSPGTLTNVIAASLNQLMGAGTSSAPSAGPTSIRSDRKKATACTVRQAYSANGNALGSGVSQIEHIHSGYPFADAAGGPVKEFPLDSNRWGFPVLVGPASFQLYWYATTTAASGYGSLAWIEFGSERVS